MSTNEMEVLATMNSRERFLAEYIGLSDATAITNGAPFIGHEHWGHHSRKDMFKKSTGSTPYFRIVPKSAHSADVLRSIATGNVTRLMDLDKMGPVWQPDCESEYCTICGADWTFLLCMRHHCRCCGFLVCEECIEKEIKLPWCIEESYVCKVCLNTNAGSHQYSDFQIMTESKYSDSSIMFACGGGVNAHALYRVPNFPTTGKEEYCRLLDLAVAVNQLSVVKWLVTFKCANASTFSPKNQQHYYLHKDVLLKKPEDGGLGSCALSLLEDDNTEHKRYTAHFLKNIQLPGDLPRPILQSILLGHVEMSEYLFQHHASSQLSIYGDDAVMKEVMCKLILEENLRVLKLLVGNIHKRKLRNDTDSAANLSVLAHTFLLLSSCTDVSSIGIDILLSVMTTVLSDADLLQHRKVYYEMSDFVQLPRKCQEWLLSHSQSGSAQIKSTITINWQNMLHDAMRKENDSVLVMLLMYQDEDGNFLEFNYNLLQTIDPEGLSLLHYASRRGMSWAIKLLLDRGASADAREKINGLRPVDLSPSPPITSVFRTWEHMNNEFSSPSLLLAEDYVPFDVEVLCGGCGGRGEIDIKVARKRQTPPVYGDKYFKGKVTHDIIVPSREETYYVDATTECKKCHGRKFVTVPNTKYATT